MLKQILFGITVILFSTSALAATDTSVAHQFMNEVDKSASDTPNHMGYLETAIAEAKTAEQHAHIALSNTTDLAWMKLHTGHVLQALTGKGKGPGLGYGVIRATRGVIRDITQAAKVKDTTANIQLHSKHVRTSAHNTLKRAEKMVAIAHQIERSSTATAAKPLVERLATLSSELINGADDNGDGKITWQDGGLAQCQQHMQFMRQGENM